MPPSGRSFDRSTPRFGTSARAIIALLLAFVMMFAGGSQALAAQSQAATQASAPTALSLTDTPNPNMGCNYADTGTGPYADSLCWFDFSTLDPAKAKSAEGQTLSIVVAGGNVFTATFHLEGQDVKPVAFPTYNGAYLGNRGFYTGVAGKPALYQQNKAIASTLTLSDISLVSPQGKRLDNFALVGADAEATDNRESLTWKSDVSINQLPLNQLGNACGSGFNGEGTTEVTCLGKSESGQQKTGTPMVAANNPTVFSQILTSRGMQGVAFGVLVSSVSLKKNVIFPVNGDNFQISTNSPDAQLGTAETGPSGTSAATGRSSYVNSVASKNNNVVFSESALSGSLDNYQTTWSCTNNGSPVDVPESAVLNDPTKRGFVLPVTVGDALDCTMTNVGPEKPALTLVKTADTAVITKAGQKVTYAFKVTNTGNVTMNNVKPSEKDFTGTGTMSAITPDAVTLKPGESRTFAATYITSQDDVSADSVKNTAVATGTSDYSNTPATSNESSVSIPEEQNPALTIVKSADTEKISHAGQVVNYTFVVKNTGNVTLNKVVPFDSSDTFSGKGSLGAITPSSVTLKPGESQSFTAPYTVEQADVDATTPLVNTATASGVPQGKTEPVKSDPSTVSLDGDKKPSLIIKKTADVKVITKAAQKITYSFDVQNTGNVTLQGVKPVEKNFSGSGTMSDITPDAVDLTPGQSKVFTATYVTTQADVESPSVTNVAIATGTADGVEKPVESEKSEVDTPAVQTPSLALVKSADTEKVTAAGQTVTYLFKVTNTGNVTMTNVAPVDLKDKFTGTGSLGEITPGATTLTPGESRTFSAKYVATQADIDAASITNVAVATGTAPDTGTPVNSNESTITIPEPQHPALTIVKSADTDKLTKAGQVVNYTFVVKNTGNVTLENVAPKEGSFNGTGEFGAIAPTPASSKPISLQPGESYSFTVQYTATQADVDAQGKTGLTNTATATGTVVGSGEAVESDPSTVSIPDEQKPALAIKKTADVKLITAAGQKVTYTFDVQNTGNVSLTNVKPDEVKFTGAGTLGKITPASANLKPGESALFTATYTTVQADVDAASITNVATATGTAPGSDTPVQSNESEIDIPVHSDPALEITKTASVNSEDGTNITEAGQKVTYKFTVANTGNVTLSGVQPSEVKFSGTGKLGEIATKAGDKTVSLKPGETADFFAEYTVTQADVNAGSVKNVATASGTTPGDEPVKPKKDSEVDTPVQLSPSLELVKSADTDLITKAGQTVTYLFKVTNTGNVTLNGVSPTEKSFNGTGKVSGITPASATLQPGETRIFTATYVATQDDVDAVMVRNEKVTNTAVATGTTPGANTPVTSNESSVSIPEEQNPALTIVKSADTDKVEKPGQAINYTFVVKNTGNVTLNNVKPVEGDFSGEGKIGAITPESATLKPGESQSFTAQYVVTEKDYNAEKPLVNTATAQGTPPGTDTPVHADPSTVTLDEVKNPKLIINKTADIKVITKAGQTVTYTFDVQNTGNVTLSNVKPEEVDGSFTGTGKLGAITPDQATLKPGESATFTATYITTQADVEAANVKNAAIATGKQAGSDEPVKADPSEVVVPTAQIAGINIVKSAAVNSEDGKTITAAGQTVTYSFEVENTGNVTLKNVKPNEGAFSGSGKLSEIETEEHEQSVTLAPNEKATFFATYVVTQADIDAGNLSNTATASGTAPGSQTPIESGESKVDVPVKQNPAINVTKVADTELITEVGQQVKYTFVVENTGNVTLTGARPVEGSFGGTGKLTPITTANGDVTVTLAPGEKAEFFTEYTVTQADLDAANVTNTASATGTNPGGEKVTPEKDATVVTPTDRHPSLAIVKTADTTLITKAGQTVTYTFEVENTGNVTVTDVKPVETTFTGTGTLGTITTKSGDESVTLAPGEKATFTATYVITQADVTAGGVTNTATAGGTPPEGTELPPVNDSSVKIVTNPVEAAVLAVTGSPATLSATIGAGLFLMLGGVVLALRNRRRSVTATK